VSIEGAANSADVTIEAGSSVVVASSVVNAATFAPGISPGALATVYGANLAGGTRATAPFPWPASLAGVGIQLNGQPVPVLYVSDQQINFLVPPTLTGLQAELTVTNSLGRSVELPLDVFPVAPGIFFDASSGFGAILNSGSADTTGVRPASRGSFIEIYCTGLGATRNLGDGLQRTAILPQVAVGGFSAQVTFSGLAPGFLGLYQVNVQVPNLAAPGTVPVVLSQNGSRSNEVKVRIQ
jgi:uncharacterized protein (TIGR03437 family)